MEDSVVVLRLSNVAEKVSDGDRRCFAVKLDSQIAFRGDKNDVGRIAGCTCACEYGLAKTIKHVNSAIIVFILTSRFRQT